MAVPTVVVVVVVDVSVAGDIIEVVYMTFDALLGGIGFSEDMDKSVDLKAAALVVLRVRRSARLDAMGLLLGVLVVVCLL